jgi:hypothetical protein
MFCKLCNLSSDDSGLFKSPHRCIQCHKKKCRENSKKYRVEHKDKYNEYQKQYQKKNNDVIYAGKRDKTLSRLAMDRQFMKLTAIQC